ncbi:uncharacterized protein [Clytia hemisphaerica]|eukprot:TCONS_00007158-protein
MKILTYLLLLALLVWQSLQNQSLTLNFGSRGKKFISGKILLALSGIKAPHLCVANCLAFGAEKCKSVNYNKKTKECQLMDENQQNVEDEDKFENDEDWEYYGEKERKMECFSKGDSSLCCIATQDRTCQKPHNCSEIQSSCSHCKPGFYSMLDGRNVFCNFSTDDAVSTCKTIKDVIPTTSSGFYFIAYGQYVVEYYCDMTTDSGGWTMFTNVTVATSTDAQNNIYDNIKQEYLGSMENVKTGRYALHTATLEWIQEKTGFSEMRIKCHKPSLGFHVDVLLNYASEIFGNSPSKNVHSPADFRPLPDDTRYSQVSGQWVKGTIWYTHILYVGAKYHIIIDRTDRWECGDYVGVQPSGVTYSPIGNWQFFFR